MAEGEGVLVRKERNEENNKKKEIYMKKGSDIGSCITVYSSSFVLLRHMCNNLELSQ
jgi:lipid-binding SYLF domain-containing protein